MSTHPALTAGRVAVVTGAASGIGLAAAQRFAALGMRVCLADRDDARLAEAVSDFPSADVGTFVVDVSDRASVAALAASITERFGAVSVLMNNAGVGGGGDALSNRDGWTRVLGVNVFGVLHGVQAFVPTMADSGEPGLVINTGSKQGITQPPGAWVPDQVVDRLLAGIAAGEFYILCQDDETTREQDEKRILWAAQDLIENRPALSRWHPDWKDAFARFMAGQGN